MDEYPDPFPGVRGGSGSPQPDAQIGVLPRVLVGCCLVVTACLAVAAQPGFRSAGLPGWLAAAAGGCGMASMIMLEYEAVRQGLRRVPRWAPPLMTAVLVLGDIRAVNGPGAGVVCAGLGAVYLAMLGLGRQAVERRVSISRRSAADSPCGQAAELAPAAANGPRPRIL